MIKNNQISEIFEIIKIYCYKFNSQKKLRIKNKKDNQIWKLCSINVLDSDSESACLILQCRLSEASEP